MAARNKGFGNWLRENQDLLLKGAVTVGAMLLVKNIAESFGLLPNKSERQSEEEQEKYVEEVISKQQPTQPKGYWAMIADSIYEALKYSAASDNKAEAERLLKLPKNDADVAMLLTTYGKRQTYWFSLPEGGERTLPQLLSSGELSSSRIKSINENYKNKGIKYRW